MKPTLAEISKDFIRRFVEEAPGVSRTPVPKEMVQETLLRLLEEAWDDGYTRGRLSAQNAT